MWHEEINSGYIVFLQIGQSILNNEISKRNISYQLKSILWDRSYFQIFLQARLQLEE